MKIVHICISAPYIDGWGYQENLLPKYLQSLGVQNHIVASANHFPEYLKSHIIEEIKAKGSDYIQDDIVVHRIQTIRITSSLFATRGLRKVLDEIQPDAIFHHNLKNVKHVQAQIILIVLHSPFVRVTQSVIESL